jgi:azurin
MLDWYNFIAQHNPTPAGFSVGRGAAYETSMRDHSRGRIYRIVYRGAPPVKKRSLSVKDPAGLLEALAADNMFWRLHAQRLIVERRQKDVVPQLIALVRNRSVDQIGTNGGALHALWTLHGLGELNTGTTEAYRAAVQALKHPAAGVRKAAAMVLPRTAEAGRAILGAGLLHDPDMHTRLAVTLAIADMPTSPEIGPALYQQSQAPDSYGDKWLSRALYIAAIRHQKSFTSAYHADRHALPSSALPVSLRMGNLKPDWRAPEAADLASEWKDMQVPGNWESRGLPDFDGVVWFTRTVDVPHGSTATALSLGPIRNTGEVWVNGLLVTPAPLAPAGPPPPNAAPAARGATPAGGGRGWATYYLSPGAVAAGKHTITVRIQNPRNEGGFIGTPESMYLEVGNDRIPLAGTWKYRIERQTNAGALYTKPGQLAAHVAFTSEGGAALSSALGQAPDVSFRLSVIPQQLKFDRSELTVAPGQLVEIVFSNPDTMQHNFVLGASGSLQQIGAAADQLSTLPTGLAQQYVPDIPQVMVSTKLLEPGQTITFQFTAPAAAGQYPYVCTFPSHWRVMNGVLNVSNVPKF